MRICRALIKKEILDILRDKKTLLVMVAVPVLLYPLMIIGVVLGFRAFSGTQQQVYTIGYLSQDQELAQNLEEFYREKAEDLDWEMEFVPLNEEDSAAEAADKREDLCDAWMMASGQDGQILVQIYYTSTQEQSDGAGSALEELIEQYRQKLVKERLEAAGESETFLYPVTAVSIDGASTQESFGMDLGGSIGMLLIVTILMGAVYPAIDATAGEKERGTLETLLTLPVSSFQIMISKYVSVALFACVTALLSLISLGGSVLILVYGAAGESAGELLSVSSLCRALPLLLPVMFSAALILTALCMCFCIFARSFKEANNYVTPLMLFVLFACMAALFPGVTLNGYTALIPVVNAALLVKQVLSGQQDAALTALTIAGNLLCSVLVIWILSKLYNSENILFSDGTRSFRLFQRRSEIPKGSMPQVGDLIVLVTAAFLLLLYGGTAATAQLGLNGVIVEQLLLLAVPLLAAWYLKSDPKRLFSLRLPTAGGALGGLIFYAGAYCLVLVASAWMSSLFSQSADALEETYSLLLEQPLAWLLFTMAFLPAICEELLFRGLVLGGLRARLGRGWAILCTGLVFAVFHMSLVKLLPTFLLGAAFAWIVAQTGSIFLSMAFHFLNNALSVLAMVYPERIAQLFPLLTAETISLWQLLILLAAGAFCLLAGEKMLTHFTRPHTVE